MEIKIQTGIIDFCDRYKKKQNETMASDTTSKFTVNFKYVSKQVAPFFMMGDGSVSLLELDNEDLEYLYKKYSKKARDEMNKNIDEITKIYGSA